MDSRSVTVGMGLFGPGVFQDFQPRCCVLLGGPFVLAEPWATVPLTMHLPEHISGFPRVSFSVFLSPAPQSSI